MNKIALWLGIAVVVAFTSCRKPPAKSATVINDTLAGKVEKISVKEIDFQYFRSKSKITYTDASDSQTATVDLRIRKDSIIWFSVSKIGVEGLRGMITKDSIFVIDRLNNDYQKYDFSSLSKKFNFPITFDLLQAAILGNLPVQEKANHKIKVIKEKDFYLLRQKQDSVTIDNYVSVDNLKLKKILVVEQPSNNSLTLNYDNFTVINDVLFPYNSLISLKYKSSEGTYHTAVTIQHTKAEITDKELKFPFNVPSKYERK